MSFYDEDDFPRIGPIGSLHNVGDDGPPPRLWGMRSVSKAAARALDRRPPPAERPAGFFMPRRIR